MQTAEFLYETRLFPELEYTFKHALTHELAYRSLLAERRRILHRQIVTVIEQLYADRLAEHVERLAHHAVRGELWNKALSFLRQAGTKSASRSAYSEAATSLEQALLVLQHLPESEETLKLGIDLRFELRSSLQALGKHERVFEHLQTTEKLASALGDQDRLGWASAYASQYLWRMGHPKQAAESGQRALTIASQLDDFALGVVANFFVGQGYFNVGDYCLAIEHCRRNVAVLKGERAHERLGLTGLPSVLSHTWLALSLAQQGEFQEAMVHGREALSVAEAVGQPYSVAAACLDVGQLHLVRGALTQAIPALERATKLCRTWDLGVIFPTTAALLGLAYALCNRFAEALPVMDESKALATSVSIFDTPTATTALGTGYLLSGRIDDAARIASRAADLAAARGFRGNQASTSQLLGEVNASRNPPEVAQAEEHYRRALALGEELGMRPFVAHCHRGLGRLFERNGELQKAEEHVSTAAEMYQAMDMGFWLEQVSRSAKTLT